MEKESDMNLQWFGRYWLNTTKTIDYGIKSVRNGKAKKETILKLERIGLIPAPVEATITYKNGSKQLIYIPSSEMYGEKKMPEKDKCLKLEPWAWVSQTYELSIPRSLKEIKSIQLDQGEELADIDRSNNRWPVSVNDR